MRTGAIIIGDEIIRGKREDKHFAKLIEILRVRGMRLDWCKYLGDRPDLITATLRFTMASEDIVFSFGGIGATPDDHTRQCAADAAGVQLALHPDAEAAIELGSCRIINIKVGRVGGFSEAIAVHNAAQAGSIPHRGVD